MGSDGAMSWTSQERGGKDYCRHCEHRAWQAPALSTRKKSWDGRLRAGWRSRMEVPMRFAREKPESDGTS